MHAAEGQGGREEGACGCAYHFLLLLLGGGQTGDRVAGPALLSRATLCPVGGVTRGVCRVNQSINQIKSIALIKQAAWCCIQDAASTGLAEVATSKARRETLATVRPGQGVQRGAASENGVDREWKRDQQQASNEKSRHSPSSSGLRARP